MLFFYRRATDLAGPALRLWLRRRVRLGKEAPDRLSERFGRASLARPGGRLIWLHVASLGEAGSILALIDRLLDAVPDAAALVTSGTLSSARLLEARLPARACHQFLPLDRRAWVDAFLDHWRPELAILVESELWPNLIEAARQRLIPLALINARMSPRSLARWRLAPATARRLLGAFALLLAADDAQAERLAQLAGRPVATLSNLKLSAESPPADAAALSALSQAIGDRPAWLAASTHEGEEDIAAAVDARLRARRPDLLTIIVPRHAERGDGIAAALAASGRTVARRSRGEPIAPSTQLYLADTMGELGLFYRLAPVAFIGKSLTASGGHNPVEPALLGAAILSGPAVGNFAGLYRDLVAADAAELVADGAALAVAVDRLLGDPALRHGRTQRAASYAAGGGGVLDAVAARLLLLMKQGDAAA